VLQLPLPSQTRQVPLQRVPLGLFDGVQVLPSAAQTPVVHELPVLQVVPVGQLAGVGVGVGVAVPPGVGVGVVDPPGVDESAFTVTVASSGVAVSALRAS
jgi:hypothetical protein